MYDIYIFWYLDVEHRFKRIFTVIVNHNVQCELIIRTNHIIIHVPLEEEEIRN